MRNLLDQASVAQCLDGKPSDGETARPRTSKGSPGSYGPQEDSGGSKLCFSKDKSTAVGRREHVKLVRGNERGGLGADCCRKLVAGAAARVDGLDHTGVGNGHMDETARRVEEGRIRGSGQPPLVANFPGGCVQLYQRAAVARDVEEILFLVDIEAVCAIR